jgi:UDP-glucose 4-epimerase
MRALVTGGAGFIGSNLVDALMQEGYEVRILDNLFSGPLSNIEHVVGSDFVPRDIRDKDLDDLFEGVDVVFHLACRARVQPSIQDPLGYSDVNTQGHVNLLEYCRKHNVTRLVFSSSSSVYGDPPDEVLAGKRGLQETDKLRPMSPYGLQKSIGEQYCQLYCDIHGMDIVSLRYFNVYGERQCTEGAYRLVMGIFASQRQSGKPLTIVGDGEQRRDFTYVGDVVRANILSATAGLSGHHVFNCGAGDNRSVNDIARLFGGPTVRIADRIEPKVTQADHSRIHDMLGWQTTVKVEEWVPGWLEEVL